MFYDILLEVYWAGQGLYFKNIKLHGMAVASFLHRGPGLPKLILRYSSRGRAKEKDRGEPPMERDASRGRAKEKDRGEPPMERDASRGRAKEKDWGELPTKRDASRPTLFPVRPTVLFLSSSYWPYDLRQITQFLQPTFSLVGLPREIYSLKWR